MFTRTLGLSATLALAANAILIPPSIALEKTTHEEHVAPLEQSLLGRAVVQFDCPGCPYATFEDDKKLIWTTTGVENSLVYEFSTGKYHDRLSLNGVQLFPPAFEEPEPFYIHQVPSGLASEGDLVQFISDHPDRQRLRITKMMFTFDSAQTVSEDGNELLSMQLTVSGLEDQTISPQLLRINVIKDNFGNLYIAGIQGLNDPKAIEAEEEKQCESWPLLCKWREIVEDRLSALKSSMSKHGKPSKGCHRNRPSADRIKNPHHMRPGHGRPRPHHDGPPHRHHHHHHSQLHRVMRSIAHIIRVIVVPILVGVAAGVATYMAGLMLGMIVAFIWIKIRGRRAEYNRVALDEEDADDDTPPYSPADKGFYATEESSEADTESLPAYEEKEAAN